MGIFTGVIKKEIPADKVAALVVTALRNLGWDDPFVNIELNTISSHLARSENVMGQIWQYEFMALITWRENPSECELQTQISELSYPWTGNDCGNWFTKISEALESVKNLSQEPRPDPETSGASWATSNDLVAVGYFADKRSPQSLIVGKADGRLVRLTTEDTYKHALVCGPTGSGKTSGKFVPNLIDRIDCNALVTEATGSKGRADLYEKTAGYRAVAGHQIYFFNPDDLCSHRVNPLDFVKTYSEARRITEIIMRSTTLKTHKGDQTWEMAERLLLTSLILHVVGERYAGNCNLSYVLRLLNLGAEGLAALLSASRVAEARDAYQGFLNNSTDNYRNLVAAGLITRLELWKDPRIEALTARTDIPYQTLGNELFTWYLATPAHKPELKPLAALVFNIAMEIIATTQFKHNMTLMLDEFTNFGYISGFSGLLTILRHDKIPVLLGIQDYVQLELLYEKEAPLFLSQPGTRIFFRPNDLRTAQHISRALGMEETNETSVTSAGQLHADKRRSPLLSAEELLALEPDEVIIFTPRTNPMKLKAITWRDFERETDERRYCPPPRPALKVNDRLSCYELEEVKEVWGIGVNQQLLLPLAATAMEAATAKHRVSAEAVITAETDRKAEVAAAKQQPKTYPDPANIIHELYVNDDELQGGWGLAC